MNENNSSTTDPQELERMIMTLLITAQPRFKGVLLKDVIAMRDGLLSTENEAFHEDVNKQFKEQAFKIMCDAITLTLACSPEAVYNVLEHLNIDEYLRA